MAARVERETPRRKREFLISFEVGVHYVRMWTSWVQIHRNAKGFSAFENIPELPIIKEGPIRVTIDHRALEPETPHRAVQFYCCGRWIRGWDSCKAGKP